MATILDVIKSSLRKIRVLGAGQTPSAEDTDDVLAALNTMLDAWSADNLAVYALTAETYALTEGDNEFTIGTAGDTTTARPDSIHIPSCFIRDSNGIDYPLSEMTREEYSRIADKDSGNSIPEKMLYDPTYPSGTIILWPPPESGLTIHIYSAKPFTAISDVYDTFTFPPGYQEAIEYNLAVRIAGDFGKPVAQDVYAIAEQSLSKIKSRARARRPVNASLAGSPFSDHASDFDIDTGE